MTGVFEHNIHISLMVIGGEFETALVDIIEQLESPATQDGRVLTAWETGHLIAEALQEGFAGLPPNGFDFACWLWETAPLHVVTIPHANSIGTSHGYRYGVVHLRKIAAMIAGTYVQQQPQKTQLVIELIDMSLDWVDARNLITHALLEYYEQHFLVELPALAELSDSPRSWRRLVPLGVAARLLGTGTPHSGDAYGLVRRSCAHADDPNVYEALRYVLRIAGMYGDQHAFLGFLAGLQRDGTGRVASLVCEFLRNPRLSWDGLSRDELLRLLRQWREEKSNPSEIACIDRAIERLHTPAS
jgi:hypothetical protein